ncbi:MAG: hypothetical protein ACTSRP_07165 [Candidatus Helarchaeota archaeon]
MKDNENYRKELKKILINASEVINGKRNILNYNVNAAIEKVKNIREHLKEENLWAEGVSALKLLYRIRKKQDEIILKILSGDLEFFAPNYSEAILKFLENEELLKNIGSRLYRTQKINLALSNIDFDYSKEIILSALKKSQIVIETIIPEEEIPEIKITGEYKSKKFKETLNNLYRLLKEKHKLPLLETILTDSFLETFLRIQCISYLFTYSYVKLVEADESERIKAGRWMIVDSSSISDFNEKKVSSSFIIGLSYKNWKKLQPFLKNKNFENRPLISTID